MFGLTADDVIVNGFPLFHVAGSFVFGLSVLCAGGCILIPTRLGMRNRAFFGTIWEQVERYGVTLIAGVPTLVSSISNIAVNADIRSLRLALVGGSPLPSDLADAFERNVGRPIRNILGLTECAGIATVEPFDGPRIAGSTGLPLPFTRIRAFRSANGNVDLLSPCALNESGVIALRGPNVGLGYTNRARNEGTFEPNGWLISGDLGHVDADGRVFITGRAKDVIIRGGHNIDPLSIEEALLQHPEVEFAAAVGQPDPYSGELPVAFVSLRNGSRITNAQLLAFVAPRVAEPAAIPKHIEVLEQLPLTPVGKVYKPALRAIAAARAFIDIFTAAGFAQYLLRSDDSGITVEIFNADDERLVRSALLGMPVKYNVSPIAETRSEPLTEPATISLVAKRA